MNKRVLVVAAHPDDELLGCGGTLARHVSEGDEVRAVIVCEGESLRYVGKPVGQMEAAARAAAVLGLARSEILAFPDQRLDTFSLVDVITPIEKIVDGYKPEVVYVHHGGDINRDHRIVHEAVGVALRPAAGYPDELYSFYTVGSTEWNYPNTFRPNVWVDISDYLEQKINAFLCYDSEVRRYPHPRSPEALRNLASCTGNQCCMAAAEAFMLIRGRRR